MSSRSSRRRRRPRWETALVNASILALMAFAIALASSGVQGALGDPVRALVAAAISALLWFALRLGIEYQLEAPVAGR